jgi:ribosomal protein L31
MGESTFACTLTSLRTEVCDFLGCGRTYASASTNEQARISAAIDKGLHRFYFEALDGEGKLHFWSFLRPTSTLVIWGTTTGTRVNSGTTTLTNATACFHPSMVGKAVVFTVSGTSYTISSYTSTTAVVVSADCSGEGTGAWTITADGYGYRLPDGFGSMRGRFTYAYNEGTSSIETVSEQMIRRKMQTDGSTGSPYWAAIRPVASTGATGQRFEACFFPIPDGDYTLSYSYNVLPDILVASTYEYPLGGARYANAILCACKAEAERSVDDQQGTWEKAYREALAAAIEMDRDMDPDFYGYNANSEQAQKFVRTLATTYNGSAVT